ncbi:hypothetical protein [Enemella sp. A6]|uniref:hypothetical protein n=1 Tax=Enemella sp. A6 TaxID=3440152 RepID=UPI003EB6DA05
MLAGLLVVAIGLVAFFLLRPEPQTTTVAPQPTTPAPEQTSPSEAPSETKAPKNEVPQTQVPEPERPKKQAPPERQAPPPPPQEQEEDPMYEEDWPPGGTKLCGDPDVAVNSVTSCQFAYVVRQTYIDQGPGTYDVYSPVTGKEHRMTCEPPEGNAVRCTGGTNALLWFWWY